MSCSNWESGTLKLSVAEYARFKRAFREGFNKLQESEMTAATRHWEKYKSGKLPKWHQVGFTGKKYGENYDQNRAVVDFDAERQRFYRLWQKWMPKPTENHPQRGSWEDTKRPRKPTRKDFPIANNKQTAFPFDQAGVDFKSETREVSYNSGNNNHQVERAREHEVAKLFFRLLESTKWTRGTGGKLIGNDEYNQESDGEGRGGNYVTETYPRPTSSGWSLPRGLS